MDSPSPDSIGAPVEPWAVEPSRVLVGLESAPDGISTADAEARLRAWGPNVLEEERVVRPAAILLRQFRSPLIYCRVRSPRW
jgi:hypothetical protein